MRILIFLIFTSILFTGCISTKQNVKYDLRVTKENKSLIKGKLHENKLSSKDIYVVIYKHKKGNKSDFSNYKLIDFSSYSKFTKNYEFQINEGLYFIYAFQNLEVLKEQRYAYEFMSDFIYVDKSSEYIIDIKLSKIPRIVKDTNILVSKKGEKQIFNESSEIKKTTLDDKVFNRHNSYYGIWEPLKFFFEVRHSLYTIDDFDKNKKILLFVHGMNGLPTDFRYIIDNLDRTKYLPILFFYPTGINLNYSVNSLIYEMEKLKAKYGIKEISIIAHSMGGLVSRSFISRYSRQIKINKFITIATPWNGQKYAELGGKFAKSLAASFGNMVPNSVFLQNMQNEDFPNDLEHYLFFTFKGKKSFVLDPSNDGVISLSSQLYEIAQKRAYKIHGFNNTHTDILKSENLTNKIYGILE